MTHLWNPRFLIPDSIMPGHPWLFEGSADKPKREALDLVEYLEGLGRSALLADLGSGSDLKLDPELAALCGLDPLLLRPQGKSPVPKIDPPADKSARQALANDGASLFARECKGCHGAGGKGEGPGAITLLPIPRDLTSARFSTKRLAYAIWSGIPGTSMPASDGLSKRDLEALVVFIEAISTQSLDDAPSLLDPQEAEQAFSDYKMNCALCHGLKGGGDGFSAAVLAPRPTNFQEQRPTREHAIEVIANGIAGSAMPPWKLKVNNVRISRLADLVRTFYRASAE